MSDTTSSAAPIEVDEKTAAAAFSEWDRRYRANPEKFWDEVTHLLRNTPQSYGEACAAYFLTLLRDQKDAADVSARPVSASLQELAP